MFFSILCLSTQHWRGKGLVMAVRGGTGGGCGGFVAEGRRGGGGGSAGVVVVGLGRKNGDGKGF